MYEGGLPPCNDIYGGGGLRSKVFKLQIELLRVSGCWQVEVYERVGKSVFY